LAHPGCCCCVVLLCAVASHQHAAAPHLELLQEPSGLTLCDNQLQRLTIPAGASACRPRRLMQLYACQLCFFQGPQPECGLALLVNSLASAPLLLATFGG
ncbi:hypothetical protein COO60DRAFT_1519876, partial [Scenedesmus sp. NREL 46B-D3]